MQCYDLCIVTNDLDDIYIHISRGGSAARSPIPSIGCRIGRKILSFEYQLSPAIEYTHGLYVVQPFPSRIEDVVDAIVVGGEGIGDEIALI